MSSTNSLDNFIASWVLHQKKFLTYRLLSRERSIHVDDARRALQQFLDDNSDDVKATFVVQGQSLQSPPTNGRTDSMDLDTPEQSKGANRIVLVAQDAVQDKMQSMAPGASSQIYALFPAASSSKTLTTTDLGLLSTVSLTLTSNAKSVQSWEKADRGSKLGVLYNPRVRAGDPRAVMAAQQLAAQQAKEQEAQSKAAIKKEDSKPVKPESAAKPAPSTSTSSSNKTDKRTSPEKGATGLNWNKAKPKGSSASSSTKTKATAEAPAEDGSDQSDVEMAQIGYADSDDEADNAPAGRAPAKRADGTVQPKASSSTARRRESKGTAGKSAEEREEERRKLREMMEVEESNEDQPGEGVPPDVSTKAEASTSTMKGTDGKQTSKTAEKGELDDASTAAPSRRKVRRKRRVVRKESGKDAKGYRFTREVSDYESYSDWTDTEEKPASAANKKAKGQAAQKRQEGKEDSEGSRDASPSTASIPPSKPKSVAPAQSKPAPAPRPASGAGGGGSGPKKGGVGGAGGGQSKLSSFFKKG